MNEALKDIKHSFITKSINALYETLYFRWKNNNGETYLDFFNKISEADERLGLFLILNWFNTYGKDCTYPSPVFYSFVNLVDDWCRGNGEEIYTILNRVSELLECYDKNLSETFKEAVTLLVTEEDGRNKTFTSIDYAVSKTVSDKLDMGKINTLVYNIALEVMI